jgi:hypothetical protein
MLPGQSESFVASRHEDNHTVRVHKRTVIVVHHADQVCLYMNYSSHVIHKRVYSPRLSSQPSTSYARPRENSYLIDQITFANPTSPCRPTTHLGMPPMRPPDRTQMSRFSCVYLSPCLTSTTSYTSRFPAYFIAVQQAWRRP